MTTMFNGFCNSEECRKAVVFGFHDWVVQTAEEYFDTCTWTKTDWERWENILKEMI